MNKFKSFVFVAMSLLAVFEFCVGDEHLGIEIGLLAVAIRILSIMEDRANAEPHDSSKL